VVLGLIFKLLDLVTVVWFLASALAGLALESLDLAALAVFFASGPKRPLMGFMSITPLVHPTGIVLDFLLSSDWRCTGAFKRYFRVLLCSNGRAGLGCWDPHTTVKRSETFEWMRATPKLVEAVLKA
jgi:hypothetical protein